MDEALLEGKEMVEKVVTESLRRCESAPTAVSGNKLGAQNTVIGKFVQG